MVRKVGSGLERPSRCKLGRALSLMSMRCASAAEYDGMDVDTEGDRQGESGGRIGGEDPKEGDNIQRGLGNK